MNQYSSWINSFFVKLCCKRCFLRFQIQTLCLFICTKQKSIRKGTLLSNLLVLGRADINFWPSPIRVKKKLTLIANWEQQATTYSLAKVSFSIYKVGPTVSLAPISLSLSCALKVTREPISISPHSFDRRKSKEKKFLHMALGANYMPPTSH